MSPAGPSALGTLLAQRLDAVLGITLSQQSNIASGARPDAVAQPGEAAGTTLVRDETLRHPQENVDNTAAQTEEQRAAPATGPGAARPGAMRVAAEGGMNSSTPTVLGRAAQAILALLDAYPDPAPVRGATALLGGAAQSAAGPGPGVAAHSGAAGGAAAAASAGTGTATQSTQGTAGPQNTQGQAGAQPVNASQQPGLAAAGTAAAQGAVGPSGPLAQHLALALRLALEHSGLFYESHLGELLAGRRSPAALRQEPQAMLGARPSPQTSTGAATAQRGAPVADAAGHSGAPGQTSMASAMPGREYGLGAMSGRDAAAAGASSLSQASSPVQPAGHAAAAAGGTPTQALLHPDSLLLVRQQLETLATQAVEWRGAAWPGAAMDWRIERRDPQQESGPAPAHWASRLTLQLPRLGMVQARLTLAGNALALRLASPEASALLESASPDLRARLLGCGLQISGLAIGTEPLPETGAAAGAPADGAQAGNMQTGVTRAGHAETGL